MKKKESAETSREGDRGRGEERERGGRIQYRAGKEETGERGRKAYRPTLLPPHNLGPSWWDCKEGTRGDREREIGRRIGKLVTRRSTRCTSKQQR